MIKTEGKISLERISDYPPMPYSFGLIDINRTGTWKYVQPFYDDKLAPCSHACPAGNDISKWMDLVSRGEEEKAYAIARSAHPFSSTLGRICPHPCESNCNRAKMGGEVAIHAVERYIGDCSLADKFRPGRPPVSGRRHEKVAIVGSGPAGLTAAYNLALKGYKVDVFEAKDAPGGYLRYGIPTYRLPRQILDAEIDLVVKAGVKIRTNTALGRNLTFSRLEKYNAVLLAIGFHKSRDLGVPGQDLSGVVPGIEVLEKIAKGKRINLGRKVAVIGGGNTAMDVARSLHRKGCKVTVYYRRTRKEMPAISSEVDEAVEEGIPIHFLTAPDKVEKRGKGLRLTLKKMKLGRPDESGRRRPVPVKGSEFPVVVDTVVTAIGETTDLSVLPEDVTTTGFGMAVDRNMALSRPGFFAAGDAATGMGTVTAAVGDGRRAAAAIDEYLNGGLQKTTETPLAMNLNRRTRSDEVVYFENLNTAYFKSEPPVQEKHMDPQKRIHSFREVVSGLTIDQARAEAHRCFKCGTCNSCENCLVFCPDVSIIRRSKDEYPYFEVDLDHCKGCGVCVAECPRDALSLKEVG
ncbi:MAG: FAD-dependent oxidoreductase [Deltaproteobacteria bacterium]|nr:FAD-dependent oxidoreductase [Deltaproteobacteria bacterium]